MAQTQQRRGKFDYREAEVWEIPPSPSPHPPVSSAAPAWTRRETAGLPLLPRTSHSASLFGEELVVFGGYGGATAEGSCARSDFVSVSVSAEELAAGDAPLQVAAYTPVDRASGRVGHSSLALDGNLYIFGGFDGAASYLGSGFLFDLEGEHVMMEKTQARVLPPPRRDHSMTATGRKVVLFGGWDMARQFNDVWALDKYDWQWRQVQCAGVEPPCERRGHSATAVGHRVYVFGGIYGLSKYLDDLYVLDTRTWTWSCPSMAGEAPSCRAWHSAVRLGNSGQILFFGGTAGRVNFYNDMYVLDTRAGRWFHLPVAPGSPLPPGRCSHVAVAVGSRVVVYGGLSPSKLEGRVSPLDDVWVLDTRLDGLDDAAAAGDDEDDEEEPGQAQADDGPVARPGELSVVRTPGDDDPAASAAAEEEETQTTVVHGQPVGGSAFHPPASVKPATLGLDSDASVALSFTDHRPVEGWLAVQQAPADSPSGAGSAPPEWVRRYFRLAQDGLKQYEHRAKGSTVVADGAVLLFRDHRPRAPFLFPGAASPPPPPSSEGARQSLGVMDVEDLLADPDSEQARAFTQFMQDTRSGENCEFFIAVEAFRRAAPADQPALARTLWDKFLRDGAPSGIIVSSAVRGRVQEALSSGNVAPDMFDAARRRVLFLMTDQHLPRYTEHLLQVQQRRLPGGAAAPALKTHLDEADKERPECESCLGRFSFHRRRNFCRLCGVVVCGGCLGSLHLPPRLGLGPGPYRACDQCRCAVQRGPHVDRAFKLQSQHRSRPLNLYADTVEETEEWVAALRGALEEQRAAAAAVAAAEEEAAGGAGGDDAGVAAAAAAAASAAAAGAAATAEGSEGGGGEGYASPARRTSSEDRGVRHLEGWLTKEDPTSKEWRRRYFVLHGSRLYYYQMSRQATYSLSDGSIHSFSEVAPSLREPRGRRGSSHVPIEPCIRGGFRIGSDFAYRFSVSSAKDTHSLAAESEAERLLWIENVHQIIASNKAAVEAKARGPATHVRGPSGIRGKGAGGAAAASAAAAAPAAAAAASAAAPTATAASAAAAPAPAAAAGADDDVPPPPPPPSAAKTDDDAESVAQLEAPTGDVTLVVATVDGHSALWEKCPTDYSTAVHSLNKLMADIIAQHRAYMAAHKLGRFVFAFWSAHDAVRLAGALHLAMLREPWAEALLETEEAAASGPLFSGPRMCVAVHLGRPRCEWNEVTARMTYGGAAMDEAVAACGMAYGGQTLVTGSVRDAYAAGGGDDDEDEVPDGTEEMVFEALGEERVGGIDEVPFFQVLPRSLAARTFGAFPRPRSRGDSPPPPPPAPPLSDSDDDADYAE